MRNALRFAVVVVLLAASCAPAATEVHYYAIYADGQKIGHAINTRLVEAGKVTTTDKASMTVTRMGQAITINTSDTCIETPDGQPLGFEAVQDMGMVAMTSKGTVLPDGQLAITTQTMGQQQARTIPWPKDAVMAEGTRLAAIKQGLAEGTTYDLITFVPSMAGPVQSHFVIGGKEKLDLLGRVVTLTKATAMVHTPMGDMSTTTYVGPDFVPQKTIVPAIGMTIEMIACDKAFAMSPNDAVDFLDKTLVQSPTPLDGLERASSATYHIVPKPGMKLDTLISTDSQTVKDDGHGGYVVTVAPVQAPPDQAFPYKGDDKDLLAATKPAQYLQSDAPKIVALAKEAVGDETDAAKAARKIEAFVHDYIEQKSLSVGYATASEVAMSKEGDCSEHAVLTAAMCRAVGIPAKVVVGYVYVPKLGDREHVFGGHAWAEARVGGKWVYLDATRNGATPGHIAEAVGDGGPTEFFGVLGTMGKFTISEATVTK
jgi:hypothetical protein